MTEPNTADWLTAIGTVGTLAATVFLFWWDRFQRNRREHRAQAVLISGWSDSIEVGDKTRDIHIANMSNEPVYNVNIFVQDECKTDGENKIIKQQITGNKALINNRFLSVLPPKKQANIHIMREKPEYAGPSTVPLIGLIFNDKDNTRWFRDWNGKVAQARKEEYDHNFHRATKPSSELAPVELEPIG